MKGCLLAPFRLMGCLTLVILLLGGWLYRDQLGDWGRQLMRRLRHQPAIVSTTGAPSPRALASGRQKLASLRPGRDSVVFGPDEVASLISDAVGPYTRGTFDSMTVELSEGRIGVRALARTDRLPAGLLGPMSMAVRDWEPIQADGKLLVVAPSRGAWQIDRLSFRDFPLPTEMVPKLMEKVTGNATRDVPVTLPPAVTQVAVHADGVVFYGKAP